MRCPDRLAQAVVVGDHHPDLSRVGRYQVSPEIADEPRYSVRVPAPGSGGLGCPANHTRLTRHRASVESPPLPSSRVFQSFTVPSLLPLTIRRPSGLNATLVMESL